MRSLRDWTFYPITTRELVVCAAVDVTPAMRRVTLGGPGLAAHTAPSGHRVQAFRSDGFDDEFKLFLRHPEEPVALVPAQLDGVLDWPRHPHLISRTYTARRWDQGAQELDVDLVLHGDGPAAAWARTVQVGDSVQIAGPKMSGTHPRGADWSLIVGDETALPAIGRWLEEFPEGARAQVFVEVGEDSHRQELTVPEGVELTWLVREGAPAGSTSLLFDAVRAAPWWPGTVFAWAAGEALTLAPLRRWLRREKQLDPEQLDVTGYWRRPAAADSSGPAEATGGALPGGAEPSGDGSIEKVATAAAAATGPEESAPGAEPQEDEDLLHAAELVGPMALRIAATIGLGSHLADGPATTAELAARSGCSESGLSHLLRYLEAIGIVQRDRRDREASGTWCWVFTARGLEMSDEWYEDRLRLDGPHGLEQLAILGLLRAVRTGVGADVEQVLEGLGIVEASTRHQRRQDRLRAEADRAVFLAGPLAEAEALADWSALRISGRGADEIALALRRARPAAELSVLVDPTDAEAMRERLAGAAVTVEEQGLFAPSPSPADAHLLVDLLDRYPDDAAIAVLRAARAACGGGRVVLVGEELEDEALDEHECEDDLLAFARGEAGLRTRAERDELVRRAGLEVVSASSVGWGFDVRVLA